ncbi:MAG: 3-dehydroquinate synthase [Candidatus Omnitrophica bacterium]|nr:3-dehydroquinate synthase [Candidatus Omnitrophota bacterium]
MKTIQVKLAKRSYKAICGFGVIKNLAREIKRLNLGSSAYIITFSKIKNRYGKHLVKSLKGSGINYTFKVVADSERSKSLQSCFRILQHLARFDKNKKVFIIAFGGGVIGDLSGFIASAYKRGIPYIQVPTTLLACVDSSIGGKTGVDLNLGKNLVGAFYQPRLVISELSFLNSLSRRQIRAGFAEIIKYAVIKDKLMFKYLEANHAKVLGLDKQALGYIVNRCVRIKAEIIQQDEREEKGIRTILNFGHTLGHAIETAGGYQKYNHGEAIALGMILASRISKKLKLINQDTYLRIVNLIKLSGLPVQIKGLSLKKILAAQYRDKKFIGSVNRFVLIKDIGRTIIKRNIPLGIIKDTLGIPSSL